MEAVVGADAELGGHDRARARNSGQIQLAEETDGAEGHRHGVR